MCLICPRLHMKAVKEKTDEAPGKPIRDWFGGARDSLKPAPFPLVLIEEKVVFITVLFVCMCVCRSTHTMACLWISEDNFQELVLSLHQVGPGYQTQVIRLCSKHLYLLSLLTNP